MNCGGGVWAIQEGSGGEEEEGAPSVEELQRDCPVMADHANVVPLNCKEPSNPKS